MGDLRINEVDRFFLEEASQASLPDYPLDDNFPISEETSSQINNHFYQDNNPSLLTKGLNALAWLTRGPAYLLVSRIQLSEPQILKEDPVYELPGHRGVLACKLGATVLGGGCYPTEPDVPDDPYPFPNDDDTPQVDDDSIPADDDTTPFIPKKCENGVLEPSRIQKDQAVCVSFVESSEEAGLITDSPHNNIIAVDYNQDGWMDLFVLNQGVPNQLFENMQGEFVEVTDVGLDFGGNSVDADWKDVDGNDYPDLLLVGENGSDILFNYDGFFESIGGSYPFQTETGGRVGAWLDEGALIATANGTRFYPAPDYSADKAVDYGLDDPGDAMDIALASFNGDKETDVFIANMTGVDRLFQNNGNEPYLSVEDEKEVAEYGNRQSTAAEWVSYNGESLPSLAVAKSDGLFRLLVQNGDDTFTDVAPDLEIGNTGLTSVMVWGDFLNEGKPCLYLGRFDDGNPDTEDGNLFLVPIYDKLNDVGHYYETAYPLGMATLGFTMGAQVLDYDRDGDLDLVVVKYDGTVELHKNETRFISLVPESETEKRRFKE